MHWGRYPAKDVKDLSFNATFVDSNSSCASILGLSPYVTKYQKISFLHFCILQKTGTEKACEKLPLVV